MSPDFCPDICSFWVCASFEKRSVQIYRHLISHQKVCDTSHIFFNSENNHHIPLANFQAVPSKKINNIPIKYSDPIYTADKFISVLKEDINAGRTHIVIDITTFTREWLLMLLAIFKIPEFSICKIICAYNYAEEMSSSWLSQGPLEMRTVLGYSGSFFSSKKTHLFLILGHEIERAIAIIDSVEPTLLTIVTGSKDGSVTEKMREKNIYFKNYIKNCYSIETIEEEIDVTDFEKSKNDIEKRIKFNNKFNTIIAPLNTKISTIAAGMVCLKNPQIQACYLPMEQYNINEFSVPSDKILFFPLIL